MQHTNQNLSAYTKEIKQVLAKELVDKHFVSSK